MMHPIAAKAHLEELLGECQGAEHQELLQHILQCAACRKSREDWKELLVDFQNLPAPQVSGEFIERMQTALQKERKQKILRQRILPGVVGLAACAAFIFLWVGNPAFPSNPSRLLAQLRQAQEADGSWNGEIGSTALATLALLEDRKTMKSFQDIQQMESAFDFLKRQEKTKPLEDLVRALAFLRRARWQNIEPSAQLQAAVDYAITKIKNSKETPNLPLLKEVISLAKSLRLQTTSGDLLLSRLENDFGPAEWSSLAWQQLSRRMESNPSHPNNPVFLAGYYLDWQAKNSLQ